MKVCELIELLKAYPPDAEVGLMTEDGVSGVAESDLSDYSDLSGVPGDVSATEALDMFGEMASLDGVRGLVVMAIRRAEEP